MSDAFHDFRRILQILSDAGVEFIVIGGQAEALFGSPRVTYDTDLCYRRTPENISKLVSVLKTINPALRGVPPGLPFILDTRTFELGSNFTFSTDAGDLDLLGHVDPLGDFDSLSANEEKYEVDGRVIHVISLDDLITVKKHISRRKDRESLMQLLAIKNVRAEQQREK